MCNESFTHSFIPKGAKGANFYTNNMSYVVLSSIYAYALSLLALIVLKNNHGKFIEKYKEDVQV